MSFESVDVYKLAVVVSFQICLYPHLVWVKDQSLSGEGGGGIMRVAYRDHRENRALKYSFYLYQHVWVMPHTQRQTVIKHTPPPFRFR
jgi:hypothetical protein